MKGFLSRNGVAFEAKDVMEDFDAYGALIAMGFRAVPVTVSGDHRIVGYDRAALEALVRESREAP